MHILFVHDAFPAQFGRLGLELVERYGWRCSYLVRNFTRCPEPTPEMLARLQIHRYSLPTGRDADDSLAQTPKFHRYAIGCRKLPPLRDLRAAFAGRAIHTNLEAWTAEAQKFHKP